MSGEWLLMLITLPFLLLALLNALLFLRPHRGREVKTPASVSVLIPARNEERTLSSCIESVLMQGDIVAEVLIYDDESDDQTGQIARQWCQRDARVRVVETVSLPDRWYGKPHACYRLALSAQGDWILFLDADTRLEPGAISVMLATAQQYEVTLLSAWPYIEMPTLITQVLMPMLNFYVMTLYPSPWQVLLRAPRYALAHGSCILCHQQTYHRLRGHSAVRSSIFEDTALARHWRHQHHRSLCVDGCGIVRVCMYRSFTEIWNGFVKNFYPGFSKPLLFWLVLALHISVFTAPFFLVLITPTTPLWIAAGMVLSMRLVLALRFRQPIWSIVFHPLAECILVALALTSWWKWCFGRGVVWKNRCYSSVQRSSCTQ